MTIPYFFCYIIILKKKLLKLKSLLAKTLTKVIQLGTSKSYADQFLKVTVHSIPPKNCMRAPKTIMNGFWLDPNQVNKINITLKGLKDIYNVI